MAIPWRVRPKRFRWREMLAATSFLAIMLFARGDAGCAAVKGEGDSTHDVNLRALRTTDDLSTGSQWVLTRDPVHPEAPGRWCKSVGKRMGPHLETHNGPRDPHMVLGSRPAVVHSGDRLLVVDHSAVVEARFDAVALNAAIVEGELYARLRFSGKIVRVVALGPGRATLAPEAGVRP